MRKMSKAAKVAAYDELVRERDNYHAFAWFVANAIPPDAAQAFTDAAGDVYEFSLYGTDRADGGTLVYVYRARGNARAHVECHRFEHWIGIIDKMAHDSGINTHIKIACERLQVARRKLYERP